MKIFFSCIISLICFSALAQAQINPYARMTDPRALARLDGDDREPLRYVNYFGYPPQRDPIDNNVIFAQDTGAGIITHIWSTGTAADSTTNFKLYIDDSLIFSNTYASFFQKIHGMLRPPFDSLYPGAQVCDVQIPYKKSFKITYIGEGWNVYFAIAWRPVRDPSLLTSFSLAQPYSTAYHQMNAESIYESLPSPWVGEKPSLYFDTVTLAPGSKHDAFTMKGQAMIQMLKCSFDKYNFDAIDSLWLNMYWDGSPYPAVHVPLAEFFCSSNGGTDVSSFKIRTDASGLTSYFPMPFATEARIELVNTSHDSLRIRTAVNYSSEAINKYSYGYFHAYFSESNPTRYHIYHPVLHERGNGKFVGFYFNSPQNGDGVVLEGDPVFTVDSNTRNNFRYTGGEDYYNSGWWFLGHLFSKPFAGQVHFLQGFYRFHILDAVDFKNSLDFVLQPGASTDLIGHFRTIAYYYKQANSFWVSRDSLRSGQRWTVSGTGYKPNSPITASFDSTQTIFTTTSNANGEFVATLIVPSHIISGPRKLSINGETRPGPIYMLSTAAIRPIADSLPVTLRYRDSLLITGTGFDPGEKVQIYLDSILISDTAAIAQSDYSFTTTVRMPNIAEWKYHLRAVGENGNIAQATDLITMTRIRPYEFEDLIPWAKADSGAFYFRNLSADWSGFWSQQSIAIYEAPGAKRNLAFKFYVPANDTFKVLMLYANGPHYGKYTYSIDGKYIGTINCFSPDHDYSDAIHTSDTAFLPVMYFPKDTHTIVFSCIGKDTASTGYNMGADLLLLNPITKMPLPKGVFSASGDKSIIDSPSQLNSSLVAYPNPASDKITLGMQFLPGITDGILDISLSDITGKILLTRSHIPFEPDAISTFDVHSLSTGNYVAEFTIHSGSVSQQFTRLIQIRE
jgi:hypothetical protein